MRRGRRRAGGRAGSTARRQLGWELLSWGAGLFVCYCALVWFEVFGHNDDAPVCFGIPHRDLFFPPATVCSPAEQGTVIGTSMSTTVAGSVLFLLAVGVLLSGAVVLLRDRRADRRTLPGRRPRLQRPAPGTTWSPGARSLPPPSASGRSLTPTPETDRAAGPVRRDGAAPARAGGGRG